MLGSILKLERVGPPTVLQKGWRRRDKPGTTQNTSKHFSKKGQKGVGRQAGKHKKKKT